MIEQEKQRVELHLHTKMTAMDGLCDPRSIAAQAAEWGMQAFAVTDLWSVQAFPEAYRAGISHSVKILYGCEIGFANDVDPIDADRERIYQIVLIARTREGLKDLYRLISLANTKHFRRDPVIAKSEILPFRDELIIGSGGAEGEVFRAVAEGREENSFFPMRHFYDYFEIQPLACCTGLIAEGLAHETADLQAFNRRIVSLGERIGVPVCATGNVYYQRAEDGLSRKILRSAAGYPEFDDRNASYFRSTNEMLDEFAYLGDETARRVVIDCPCAVARCADALEPLHFFPEDKGSLQQLKERVFSRMHALYGADPLPQITQRTEKEFTMALEHGYDPYYIAAMTVTDSVKGPVSLHSGVGSSLIAYFAGISDVNPLPPHYRCAKCRYTEFADGKAACGADLHPKRCPVCGSELERDGFGLAAESYCGIPGREKLPYIVLGLSMPSVLEAEHALREHYDADKVFQGCEIDIVSQAEARSLAESYCSKNRIRLDPEALSRAAGACVSAKRKTKRASGAYIVLPQSADCLEDLCPAEAETADGSTVPLTHFPWYELAGIVPAVHIREDPIPALLQDLHIATGQDPETIPLDDGEIFRLLASGDISVYGKLPLEEPERLCSVMAAVRPDHFGAFVRAYGLARSPEAWMKLMLTLLARETVKLEELIVYREDVMRTLSAGGIDEKSAYLLMEAARKGAFKRLGSGEDLEEKLCAHDVPAWYPDALRRAEYLPFGGSVISKARNLYQCIWYNVHDPNRYAAVIAAQTAGKNGR